MPFSIKKLFRRGFPGSSALSSGSGDAARGDQYWFPEAGPTSGRGEDRRRGQHGRRPSPSTRDDSIVPTSRDNQTNSSRTTENEGGEVVQYLQVPSRMQEVVRENSGNIGRAGLGGRGETGVGSIVQRMMSGRRRGRSAEKEGDEHGREKKDKKRERSKGRGGDQRRNNEERSRDTPRRKRGSSDRTGEAGERRSGDSVRDGERRRRRKESRGTSQPNSSEFIIGAPVPRGGPSASKTRGASSATGERKRRNSKDKQENPLETKGGASTNVKKGNGSVDTQKAKNSDPGPSSRPSSSRASAPPPASENQTNASSESIVPKRIVEHLAEGTPPDYSRRENESQEEISSVSTRDPNSEPNSAQDIEGQVRRQNSTHTQMTIADSNMDSIMKNFEDRQRQIDYVRLQRMQAEAKLLEEEKKVRTTPELADARQTGFAAEYPAFRRDQKETRILDVTETTTRTVSDLYDPRKTTDVSELLKLRKGPRIPAILPRAVPNEQKMPKADSQVSPRVTASTTARRRKRKKAASVNHEREEVRSDVERISPRMAEISLEDRNGKEKPQVLNLTSGSSSVVSRVRDPRMPEKSSQRKDAVLSRISGQQGERTRKEFVPSDRGSTRFVNETPMLQSEAREAGTDARGKASGFVGSKVDDGSDMQFTTDKGSSDVRRKEEGTHFATPAKLNSRALPNIDESSQSYVAGSSGEHGNDERKGLPPSHGLVLPSEISLPEEMSFSTGSKKRSEPNRLFFVDDLHGRGVKPLSKKKTRALIPSIQTDGRGHEESREVSSASPVQPASVDNITSDISSVFANVDVQSEIDRIEKKAGEKGREALSLDHGMAPALDDAREGDERVSTVYTRNEEFSEREAASERGMPVNSRSENVLEANRQSENNEGNFLSDPVLDPLPFQLASSMADTPHEFLNSPVEGGTGETNTEGSHLTSTAPSTPLLHSDVYERLQRKYREYIERENKKRARGIEHMVYLLTTSGRNVFLAQLCIISLTIMCENDVNAASAIGAKGGLEYAMLIIDKYGKEEVQSIDDVEQGVIDLCFSFIISLIKSHDNIAIFEQYGFTFILRLATKEVLGLKPRIALYTLQVAQTVLRTVQSPESVVQHDENVDHWVRKIMRIHDGNVRIQQCGVDVLRLLLIRLSPSHSSAEQLRGISELTTNAVVQAKGDSGLLEDALALYCDIDDAGARSIDIDSPSFYTAFKSVVRNGIVESAIGNATASKVLLIERAMGTAYNITWRKSENIGVAVEEGGVEIAIELMKRFPHVRSLVGKVCDYLQQLLDRPGASDRFYAKSGDIALLDVCAVLCGVSPVINMRRS